MNWLRFLPIGNEKRALISMAQRIIGNLATKEERQRVVAYALEMLADGTVEVSEWARFGKHLTVFKHEPPRRKGRPPKA